MHINRVTQMPAGDSQVSHVTITTHKIARPQPSGLKARFNPIGVASSSMGKIGVDASSDSEEDDEMEDIRPISAIRPTTEPTTERQPQSSRVKKTSKEKVDKEEQRNDTAKKIGVTLKESPKKRKYGSDDDDDDDETPNSQLQKETQSAERKTKKVRLVASSPDLSSSLPPPRKETAIPLPPIVNMRSSVTPQPRPSVTPLKSSLKKPAAQIAPTSTLAPPTSQPDGMVAAKKTPVLPPYVVHTSPLKPSSSIPATPQDDKPEAVEEHKEKSSKKKKKKHQEQNDTLGDAAMESSQVTQPTPTPVPIESKKEKKRREKSEKREKRAAEAAGQGGVPSAIATQGLPKKTPVPIPRPPGMR
jgi:hypothetical protein